MSIEEERLKQQFAFALEADKEKQIFRQTWLSDGERKENDAEHAWHMALMAILMAEHANEKIDILKTVTMILIHDIVEIDAGDTYAYDEEGLKTQKERENAAKERIFRAGDCPFSSETIKQYEPALNEADRLALLSEWQAALKYQLGVAEE